jgi:type I restriction enzyme S subunit
MSDSLEMLAKIHYGKSPNEVVSIDGDFPIVGTGGIYGCARKFMFESGIVVARKGSLGTPHLFQTPFWPVDTTYAVVPRDGVDLNWLYYCLLNFDLTKLNEATGVPSINRNWLAKIYFNNPGASSQVKSPKFSQLPTAPSKRPKP